MDRHQELEGVMVKKFNLSVPDELAEKIEARREYLGNLSSLFQEAVRDKIRKKEDWEKRIREEEEGMDARIERLRKEKIQSENDYYEQGREDGYAWAKNAPYADLQYMLNFDPVQYQYGRNCYFMVDLTQDEILGEGFREAFKENPVLDCDEVGVLNDFAEQWFRGWQEGVETFWEEIKDKL
jgi:Arc/MetJ-type ribon-helix-helix transcriptional regulator